jgi:hypothetical protein
MKDQSSLGSEGPGPHVFHILVHQGQLFKTNHVLYKYDNM